MQTRRSTKIIPLFLVASCLSLSHMREMACVPVTQGAKSQANKASASIPDSFLQLPYFTTWCIHVVATCSPLSFSYVAIKLVGVFWCSFIEEESISMHFVFRKNKWYEYTVHRSKCSLNANRPLVIKMLQHPNLLLIEVFRLYTVLI